ncbi:MAG TPA: metallophosphoesterase [Chondromyces sp.]|nr:metallophosphoesterase [Chondromyces sp.]
MKLLVVSDSHGRRDILEELKGRYQEKVDLMIHCGDSELKADDPAIEGFQVVKGNCDIEPDFSNETIDEIAGKRIFVTHGHRYNVKMTMMNLSYKAKEYEADFVFFGHSHLVGVEKIDGTVFLNPGSITLPKGRQEKTYAVVEVNHEEAEVRFYTDTHEEITDLRQTFSLE